MTEKLFYTDSYMHSFTAVVLSCEKSESGYEVVLDKTAFFPEGGGQAADTGTIGSAKVSYTFGRGGDVVHVTDSPFEVGTEVIGKIDWDRRFASMREHSGEHIVSGLVHCVFGWDNVGCHFGKDAITVDFSGFLSDKELERIERLANETIIKNVPINTWFPPEDELKSIEYRSKLELTEDVRLVSIEGCDICACCAMHVARTGEIGLIKILDSVRRKDGVRIRVLAGQAAFEDYLEKSASVSRISGLLSSKPQEVSSAVERLLAAREKAEWEKGGLVRQLVKTLADAVQPAKGNLVFFQPQFSSDELRMLVNSVMSKCTGIAAAFSGDDENGYRYVMGSTLMDMRASAKEINSAISGRGGGDTSMIQGSAKATEDIIRKYFA